MYVSTFDPVVIPSDQVILTTEVRDNPSTPLFRRKKILQLDALNNPRPLGVLPNNSDEEENVGKA